jgi:CheY-like chemotaxis protein
MNARLTPPMVNVSLRITSIRSRGKAGGAVFAGVTDGAEHYAVVSASSGEEALSTTRELKTRGDTLAMVISDQRMPGMLGSEVLARSRELYRHPPA